jgi:8-oxo-dGTP pyrophosphatase MutT (NUDIX family)
LKSIRTGRWQYGVLPIRAAETGIGGWPMKRHSHADAAVVEAFEEAGITGRIVVERKIGAYSYLKLQPSGMAAELKVKVFLMVVDDVLDDWPEREERVREWFSPGEASTLVAEPALAKLIRRAPRAAKAAGVEFIEQNGGGPGVRLRASAA